MPSQSGRNPSHRAAQITKTPLFSENTFSHFAGSNEGRELAYEIDTGVEAAAQALDHRDAEDDAAEGTVLLHLVTHHRTEQLGHHVAHVYLRQ